jgi:hypothetical protein
MANNNIEAY